LKPPIVTIITVSYNSAKTIFHTIESVINQTYQNIEYIIIDGASKDDTLQIIKSYANTFSNIKYISEQDNGIYNAMNKGLKLANGDIVGILNSDDWYELDAVEKVVDAYLKNTNAIHYGYMREIKNNKEYMVIRTNYEFLAERMIQHPTCFVPMAIYNKYGLFSETYKSASDYELMLRFRANNVNFIMLDYILSNFLIGGTSYGTIGTLEKLKIQKKYHIIKRHKYYTKYLLASLKNFFYQINTNTS